ncbi:MAG: nodulation protein NfeD [Chloroflexota bacterium]|nr:nodulation protein NfeD [Chloroflexota bacterium]
MIRAIAIVLLVLGLAGLALAAFDKEANAASGKALYMKIEGPIMPLTERFLSRAIKEADESGARLLIVELNTPGGLLKTTESMVDTILDAPIPVVVFVSPPGSRAASAGTFITAAGHVAAMSPSTNIGAASPLAGDGQRLLPENRASAFQRIESLVDRIVERRGRDRDALMATAENAASYSAHEAVDAGVADLIAQDVEDLLFRLDGWSVLLNGREETLDTHSLSLFKIEKTYLEHFLNFISDPNIAFMLMIAGFFALWVEFVAPGALAFAPGITGVVLWAMAIVALGNLPASAVGIALLVLAAVLLFVETQIQGIGYFGAAGVVSLLLGGLLLFGDFTRPDLQPPAFDPPTIRVNLFLVLAISLGMFAFLLFALRDIRKSQKTGTTASTTPDSVIGLTAVAITPLSPSGTVTLGGEEWTAVASDERPVEQGTEVEIIKQDGLVLTVRQARESPSETES